MRPAVPNGRLFLALNAAALLGVAATVGAIVTDRFVERRALVAEQGEALNRIAIAKQRATALVQQIAGRGDPFLSASDDRLGSADLQAILQDIVRQQGAVMLGLRGLPSPRRAGLALVTVKVECEGSLDQIQAVVKAVDDHVPLLWIDAAAMKPAGTGPEPGAVLHAEFQVQAALAPPRSPADLAAAAVLPGLAKP